jgi:hypothetical protein
MDPFLSSIPNARLRSSQAPEFFYYMNHTR